MDTYAADVAELVEALNLRNAIHMTKLLRHGSLKMYPGLPHGMPTTHADRINTDIFEFITSAAISL